MAPYAKKEKSVSACADDPRCLVELNSKTKRHAYHRTIILLQAAAVEASSNSPQISEIARGARASDDGVAVQYKAVRDTWKASSMTVRSSRAGLLNLNAV